MHIDSDVKMIRTTHIDDFDDAEIKMQVESAYSSTEAHIVVFATLLNAIYTNLRLTFAISHRIMGEMIKNDPNVNTKSCNDETYNRMMAMAKKYGVIEELKPHTGIKAAVYEVINSDIASSVNQIVGREYTQAQKAAAIEWYNLPPKLKTKGDKIGIDPGIKEIMEKAEVWK